MSDLFKFKNKDGYENVIPPGSGGLGYMGFDRLVLSQGENFAREVGRKELAIVLQKGDMEVSVDSEKGQDLAETKAVRTSVFDQKPTALYVPGYSKFSLKSKQGMKARIFSAPADKGGSAYLATPQEINQVSSGVKNWRRHIRVIFGPKSEITERLIVGETVSNPGTWIGWPAHKHDYDNEEEYPLDEIFTYQLDGPYGELGFLHIYDYEESRYDSYAIDDDNIAVAISDGYHTQQAVPGCRMYLLFGLAGETKTYRMKSDPRFTWLEDAEELFEEGMGHNLNNVIKEEVEK